jgi:hypothetical protein
MSAKQGTVEKQLGELFGTMNRAKGSCDSKSLLKAYPDSEVGEAMTAVPDDTNVSSSTLKGWYQANVLTGKQEKNTLTGTVDMDYGTAPDVSKIKKDDADEHVHPHVPDISAENADKPVYPDMDGKGTRGSLASPAEAVQSEFNLENPPIPGMSPVPTTE